MKRQFSMAARAAAVLSILLTPWVALAGDGHDHGAAPPAPRGPALPRFAAVSETFELVGVLSGRQVTLYLDRYADNTPVPDARIELEIAGRTYKAERHDPDADSVYKVVLEEAPRQGLLPITATVTAGSETDLLAGELDIHETFHADAAAPALSWKAFAGWAVGGLAALGLLVFAARRAAASRRFNALRDGGAA